jgi:hypothetical protein
VLTLAGIIEHEQNDLQIAESDLRAARAEPKGIENCAAAFYLASTLTKREIWSDAAVSFDSSMVCYNDKANFESAKIDRVRRSTRGTPAYRAKRIAAMEANLADFRKRYYTSVFNEAAMNARMGNFSRADELLVVAGESPDLTEQVTKLKEQLAPVTRPK